MLKNSKNLLIIGGSSSIAKKYLEKYYMNNNKIILTYLNNKISFERKFKNNSSIHQVKVDLSNDNSLSKFIQYMDDNKFFPSRILHLAAPPLIYNHFEKHKWHYFENNFNIQVKSFFYILQKFLPEMKKNKNGKIISILSNVIYSKPPAYLLPYVSTKYALLGMIKSLVSEFNDYNIIFNTISPSMIESKYIKNVPRPIIELAKKNNPNNKLLQSKDVRDVINYLFENNNQFMNGVDINLSGGNIV